MTSVDVSDEINKIQRGLQEFGDRYKGEINGEFNQETGQALFNLIHTRKGAASRLDSSLEVNGELDDNYLKTIRDGVEDYKETNTTLFRDSDRPIDRKIYEEERFAEKGEIYTDMIEALEKLDQMAGPDGNGSMLDAIYKPDDYSYQKPQEKMLGVSKIPLKPDLEEPHIKDSANTQTNENLSLNSITLDSLPLAAQFLLSALGVDMEALKEFLNNEVVINPDFQRTDIPETAIEAVEPETIKSLGETIAFTEGSLAFTNMELTTMAFDAGNDAVADKLNQAWNSYQNELAENDLLYNDPNKIMEAVENQTKIYKNYQSEMFEVIHSDPDMHRDFLQANNDTKQAALMGSAHSFMGVRHMEAVSNDIQQDMQRNGYLKEAALDNDNQDIRGPQTHGPQTLSV